jgi:hypothetical protein
MTKSYNMPYESSLLSWHYNHILKQTVKAAGLRGNEKVLDFGCEGQFLKRFLPGRVKYIGFDIVPEHSDVKDYRKLKGIEVAFCLNVLDHLQEKELAGLLKDLRKMRVKKFVVAMSNNNWVCRLLEFLFSYDAQNTFTHFLSGKQIANALVKEFGFPENLKRVNLVQYVAMFEL